jgi:thiamine-phosphate pyrophosphorylase
LRTVDWSLCVIIDRTAADEDGSLVDLARAAVEGGATVLQLRDKCGPTRDTVELGREILALTQTAGIPLVVNDRADIALAIDADGVHVGQGDLPARLARTVIGSGRVLGVSAGSIREARQAEADGADYLGVGDVFGTPSKTDAGLPIGSAALAAIARAVSIPVIAIGGVSLQNAAAAIEAGAAGVAVISAVASAADPAQAAATLLERVQGARRGQDPHTDR